MYAFLILGTVYVEAYRHPALHRRRRGRSRSSATGGSSASRQDLIGVLCLVGLATFAIIRFKNQPAKLGRKSRFKGSHTGGAWVVLIMIFNVIWTMFLFRGAAAASGNLPLRQARRSSRTASASSSTGSARRARSPRSSRASACCCTSASCWSS